MRQTEIAECGLASLTMIANFHGLDIDLGTMRRRFAPSLRGAALKTLMGLADRIGLTPRAVKLPLEQLANLHVPALLHWDMNHYVVLERVKDNRALIHNPDGRSAWMPMAEVSDHFTGVALELRPSHDFQIGKKWERLRLPQLWHDGHEAGVASSACADAGSASICAGVALLYAACNRPSLARARQ